MFAPACCGLGDGSVFFGAAGVYDENDQAVRFVEQSAEVSVNVLVGAATDVIERESSGDDAVVIVKDHAVAAEVEDVDILRTTEIAEVLDDVAQAIRRLYDFSGGSFNFIAATQQRVGYGCDIRPHCRERKETRSVLVGTDEQRSADGHSSLAANYNAVLDHT